MVTSKGSRTAATLALLCALCASPAVAESGANPEQGAGGMSESPSSPLPGSEWSYSTYYIYPLTRHIEESETSTPCRYALYPITALLDTVQLPLGALAGLFGD